MEKLLIVGLFFIVFETLILIVVLLNLMDVLCEVDITFKDSIKSGIKGKKAREEIVHKKEYEKLDKRIKTLEEIIVSNQDSFDEFEECIEGIKQKYQSMVDTVDEVVDDQLQQDAEHEKAIEVVSEKLKLIADCLDRELGTGIDVRLKFEEMDDNDN